MLQKGFSLIELLVVIAIIGILSSIAYPSYQSYICSTYKGQALVALKVCALSLERYYSDGFTYVGAVVDASTSTVCSNQSPAEGQKKFTITLSAVTENSYTLSAIPLAGQTCSNVMQLTADGALTGQ